MNNSMARTVAANGVEAVGGYDTYFHANYGTEYAVLSTRLLGGIADQPPPSPPAPGGGGIIVPVDHKHRKLDERSVTTESLTQTQGQGQDAGLGAGRVPKMGSGVSGQDGADVSDPPVPGSIVPLR